MNARTRSIFDANRTTQLESSCFDYATVSCSPKPHSPPSSDCGHGPPSFEFKEGFFFDSRDCNERARLKRRLRQGRIQSPTADSSPIKSVACAFRVRFVSFNIDSNVGNFRSND